MIKFFNRGYLSMHNILYFNIFLSCVHIYIVHVSIRFLLFNKIILNKQNVYHVNFT